MTNPTHQEIINAHEALKYLIAYDLADAYTEADVEEVNEREHLIRKFLPPIPQPTMAEVEWDDDKHYLAEAEHPDYGKVIMLFKNRLDWISCFYQERSALFSEDPSLLTPTGERYTLTEVQE